MSFLPNVISSFIELSPKICFQPGLQEFKHVIGTKNWIFEEPSVEHNNTVIEWEGNISTQSENEGLYTSSVQFLIVLHYEKLSIT